MSANIVSVDEESLRNDIKNLVRKTVEETLNALLDEEASELVFLIAFIFKKSRDKSFGFHDDCFAS